MQHTLWVAAPSSHARAGALANSQALAAKCRPCQVMPQAVARACNHTCVEPSFVLSARTRLGPFSAAESTSSSSSRSWRGARRHCDPPRARGVVFSVGCLYLSEACGRWG
eukprot:scaffold163_cov142-Isochrysis_galbana.AAC.5